MTDMRAAEGPKAIPEGRWIDELPQDGEYCHRCGNDADEINMWNECPACEEDREEEDDG